MTITHIAGITTPTTTSTLASLTPDDLSSANGDPSAFCAHGRVYSVTSFDGAVIETPTVT